jgi:hypothetical protein
MKGCKSILRNCMLKESFGDLITNLHYTSVNPVHNAPVELPPGRGPPPPPPGGGAGVAPSPARAGSQENHRQCLEEFSRHCPHRQTDIVTLIYKIGVFTM